MICTLFNIETQETEQIRIDDLQTAFTVAAIRNWHTRSQPWRAYDEYGQRIVGLYQSNESGHIDRIGRA